jgi:hypothetical protein
VTTSTTAAPTTTTNPPTTTTTPLSPDGVEVLVYLVGGPGTDPSNFDCSQVAPVTRVVEPPTTLAGAMRGLTAHQQRLDLVRKFQLHGPVGDDGHPVPIGGSCPLLVWR